VFLSSIPGDIAEPFVAVFLFGLGVYILARFAFNRAGNLINDRPVPRRFLSPLGLVAGFLDAVGGGGWGPIFTPTLLSSRRMEPRKVVGTVDASEFVVALCASLGFLFGLSLSEIPFEVVGAILVGGLFAAPIAAWVVRHLNARVMGTAVGGFILLTNARTFLRAVGFDESLNYLVYAVILVVWATALFFAMSAARRERKPMFETT
jgi:uncharacterized membrane protein YfcA